MRSLLTARARWSSRQALPRRKGDLEARGGWYHRPLSLVGLAGLMSGPLRRSGIAAGMPPRGTRTAFPECRPFPAPLQPPSSCLRGTSKRGLNHQDTKKQRNSGWEPDGFPAFLVSSCLCGKSKRCGLNLPVATPLRWTVAEDGPCRALRRRRCRTRFIQHSKLGRAAAPPCLRERPLLFPRVTARPALAPYRWRITGRAGCPAVGSCASSAPRLSPC